MAYTGKERRKKNDGHFPDRRIADKVHSKNVMTKNDERYQFENLIIYYRASYNVWQVLNMKLPSYEQLLHEVQGYGNQADAFVWAKDYVKEQRAKNGNRKKKK